MEYMSEICKDEAHSIIQIWPFLSFLLEIMASTMTKMM